jgi:hypothetical protein
MTNQEPEGQASQQNASPQQTSLPVSQPTVPAKPKRNTLGLIALVIAVVGFIFACIPGALIVGWILLPIAFILGIVSLFLSGQGKGLGIAAIITSVVGTIVAVIVFFAVVATSFDEAFNEESTIGESSSEGDEGSDGDEAAEPSESDEGSRENPIALGTMISNDSWTVVVNSYNADGNATVAAGNMFNEPAPAGSHYEIVNYTATYTGAESAFAGEVTVDLVTSSGNVVDSFTTMAVLTDAIGMDELFTGASTTGSAAYAVPDGETVLIRVSPGFTGEEVFVAP